MGGASRWWLHHSIEELQASLKALGSKLVLRRGNTLDVMGNLIRETGARVIHCTRCYEPWASTLERRLNEHLAGDGVVLKRYGGRLLYEPEVLKTHHGEHFKVFSPFWRAMLSLDPPRLPIPPPQAMQAPSRWPVSERLSSWQLLPKKPDWAGGLRTSWEPGEDGALKRLSTFLDTALAGYADDRDRPDLPSTSRLSPHIHFGELSPCQCWHAVAAKAAAEPETAKGAASFQRELAWREFSVNLLHHWPQLPEQPFKAEFAEFAWTSDKQSLTAWRKGRTGYPIIDAGMRELWHTGFMHNRIRMVVASFLVKDLLISWKDGEAWFWDTLVDADLANNAASWQWVAGCGADAAPYFRIFNPVKQGQTFDPHGDYVRKWVPELAELPEAYIHAPWLAPEDVLARAGVTIGETYPAPLIDHREARDRALEAFARIRGRSGG